MYRSLISFDKSYYHLLDNLGTIHFQHIILFISGKVEQKIILGNLEDAIVKLPTPTLSSLSEVDIESNVHDISDTNVIIDILSTSVPILVSKMKIEKLITNKNLDLSEQKQSKFEGNIQCGLEIIARCSRDSFISSSVNMSDNSNKTSSQ
ncbi:unnamed protein product [Rotaria sp. Silwood1]|nr:unnamed protein product [Rotaria sp. Silwood1]